MNRYNENLLSLQQQGNLRTLPEVKHQGKYISTPQSSAMLNLSSNDYLGLATDAHLQDTFLKEISAQQLPFSASSSRLLTGNYEIYAALEALLASRFGREDALLFNSGYHANLGILPALANKQTLILADKLVHASIIDGMKLSASPFVRYRHNDFVHLEEILQKEQGRYEQYIIVTESIFSMDGEITNLRALVTLKQQYPNILLYVDEAHAIGVRGETGLGVAQEQACMDAIDLLVGTFGKALASVGAYVICSRLIKQYLINAMRPLIFSTALPPINVAWSYFIFNRLPNFAQQRKQLAAVSDYLRDRLSQPTISQSHIIPYLVGANHASVALSLQLQDKGYYALAVRPPTVPTGTARLRFSLTAAIEPAELDSLISLLA